MQYVSASDAKQRLAAILDTAQREPVMIRRQNGMWPWYFQSKNMNEYVR
jgi:hypothetical protein